MEPNTDPQLGSKDSGNSDPIKSTDITSDDFSDCILLDGDERHLSPFNENEEEYIGFCDSDSKLYQEGRVVITKAYIILNLSKETVDNPIK